MLGDTALTSAAAWDEALARHKPGDRVPLRFVRDNDGHALVEPRTGEIVDLVYSDEAIRAAPDGADLVLDSVGGAAFRASLGVLRPLGRLLIAGFIVVAVGYVVVAALVVGIGFLLAATGYTGRLSLELFNRDLWRADPRDVVAEGAGRPRPVGPVACRFE